MGYQELIESLRKEGEEKIQSVRNEANAEAEKIKTETAGQIQHLREGLQKKEAALTRSVAEEVRTEAEKKARELRLAEHNAVSERLFTVAESILSQLRDDRYPETFAALVKELPSTEWDAVKVHSLDTAMAAEHFPGAQIIEDSQITGGMEVSRDEGRRSIINTFEKRLERAWEEILPLLLNEVEKELG